MFGETKKRSVEAAFQPSTIFVIQDEQRELARRMDVIKTCIAKVKERNVAKFGKPFPDKPAWQPFKLPSPEKAVEPTDNDDSVYSALLDGLQKSTESTDS